VLDPATQRNSGKRKFFVDLRTPFMDSGRPAGALFPRPVRKSAPMGRPLRRELWVSYQNATIPDFAAREKQITLNYRARA
jgi:hypothetical protein